MFIFGSKAGEGDSGNANELWESPIVLNFQKITRGTLIYDGKNIFSSNVLLAGTKVPPRIGKSQYDTSP